MTAIREDLHRYIEQAIIPEYANFDSGHDTRHVSKVIESALEISDDLKNDQVDTELVYVAAAYHDIGMRYGRKNHELSSGGLLASDVNLKQWFSGDEIMLMKEAVEDHRASGVSEPRSIYGRIVAEADRDISVDTIVYRTVQYGLKEYPELDEEGQYQRMKAHIFDKYGENGYLKLWLNTEPNRSKLRELRDFIRSEDSLRDKFKEFYGKQ